ncbi:MAG: hypothetical protein ACLVKO_10875 [Dysgonomonas sp.]
MNEKIELYQIRDLGDRINIVFKFIKQNGKQIAKNLLYLVPVYIIAAIVMSFFVGSVYSALLVGDYGYYSGGGILFMYFILFIVAVLASVASLLALLFTISFVAEYEESIDGTVDSSLAWQRAKQSFWGTFGGSILMGIAVFVGFIFCIIPGIWLMVSFSLFIPAYVVERNKEISGGVVDCLNESFSLVKQNWFGAFGFLFIMGIISFAFTFALAMPMQIVQTSMMMVPDKISLMSILYAVATSVYYIGALFFSAITYVAMTVLYFDFKERREGLSMQRKIDNIGNDLPVE